MFEKRYYVEDVYFCKFGRVASFDRFLSKVFNIKIEKVRKGCFVKLNDGEYQHILSGRIVKSTGTPTLGGLYINPQSIQQITSIQNKYLTEGQIQRIENRINAKYITKPDYKNDQPEL